MDTLQVVVAQFLTGDTCYGPLNYNSEFTCMVKQSSRLI